MSQNAVAAAAGLADQIRSSRSETEEGRQLPAEVVRSLVDSGLFRLAVPEDLGGLELDPLSALQVYEELAKSEASAAWLVWNSSLPCLFGRFLSATTRSEVFGDPAHKYASSTRPTGRAVPENGGYRISGRWSLVSGCVHADWLSLMCMVQKDGEVEMLGPGAPHMRMAYVPEGSYEIIDTWHVGGLRGTGSHDIVVEDVKVPEERTFTPMDATRLDRPIGRMPIACNMAAGHAAMCLGIAGAALETVVELGGSKVTVDPAPGLPDRASNQFVVAEASTKIAALRAELRASLGRLWASSEDGSGPTVQDLASTWSAAVTTGRTSRDIVSALYEAAGSTALYVDCVLERCHRDIHAAMQHIVAQRFWIEEAGRARFGMEPTHPLFAL